MGRSATGSVAVRRLRRILVASQFAIAMPLLIVAGLLFASLNQLGRVDLGFETHDLLSGSIQLPATQYDQGQMRTFWNELQRRIEILPGVSDIAFTDGRPPDDVDNFNNFDLEEAPTPSGKSQPVTAWVAVTPDYFQLLGLTLLEGRLLNERDGLADNLESVVVDRAWAKRFFPGKKAVGKRFKEGGCTTCPWTSVVGVVSEVKYAGLDQPDQGTVYTALEPASRFRYIVVRTTAAPASVLANVRQVVREIDPALPFSSVATFDELIDRSLQRPRSLSLLVAAFAVVAVGPVGRRNLWCHVVLRPTARKRHQHPIGARRPAGRRGSRDRAARHGDRWLRHGRRIGDCICRYKISCPVYSSASAPPTRSPMPRPPSSC